jgi:hypothetical protein
MGQIGDRLPQFKRYVELFKSNENLKTLLSLFFKDILDFHVTALNFFKLNCAWEEAEFNIVFSLQPANPRTGRDLFFESMWPTCGNKISIIMRSIERHASLLREEVTIANIMDAHEARSQAMKRYQRDEEFQERQDLETVRQMLRPKLYDHDLDIFRRTRCQHSGEWLRANDHFQEWVDANNRSSGILWLEGIPGAGKYFFLEQPQSQHNRSNEQIAGKSFLSSYVIDTVQSLPGSNAIFAFLKYQNRDITTVEVLHSLIFQLVLDNKSLRSLLSNEVQKNTRMISSNTKHVQTLLAMMLNMRDLTYILVDGLDEINEIERSFLLNVLTEVKAECENTKLLISSRTEDDIARSLRSKAKSIRADGQNTSDIEEFVVTRTSLWLDQSSFDESASSEIRNLLRPLPVKAKGEDAYIVCIDYFKANRRQGMMLYAKLIMDSLRFLSNLQDIRDELDMLPKGLNQAYVPG